jgi:hypothetical protein
MIFGTDRVVGFRAHTGALSSVRTKDELPSVRRVSGRLLLRVSVNRHCASGNRRNFAVRLDTPALGHAITAGGEAEKRGQLDDFRVAVKLPELRVNFLISSVIERERARIM